MKEKMFELLKQALAICDGEKCKDCKYYCQEYCGTNLTADFLIENGVTITRAEDLKCTVSRDYEAEYNKLLEAHKHLCGDYAELKHDYESMETEFVRMRAQLDIVHLIFGGK